MVEAWLLVEKEEEVAVLWKDGNMVGNRMTSLEEEKNDLFFE